MSKLTMAGVCMEAINGGGVWSVKELHETCVGQGLDVLEAQVYATMQVYASQKRINRGTEKRTYLGINSGANNFPAINITSKPMVKRMKEMQEEKPALIIPALTPIKVEPVTRKKVAKKQKGLDPVQVIADITAILGEPTYTRLMDTAYTILLLPEYDYSAEWIIERWNIVLGGFTKWLWYTTGSGYIVGAIKDG